MATTHRLGGAGLAEAIGDPLGKPALDPQLARQIRRVERLGQLGWQKTEQIGGRGESLGGGHGDHPLVLHDVVSWPTPSPAAVAGVAKFFDFDQRNVDRQPLVREDPGEVDEVVEKVEKLAPLGAQPLRDDLAAATILFDELFSSDDRFDNKDAVTSVEECRRFVPDRGKRAVLDLDEPITPDHVNAEFLERHLKLGVRVGIMLLQLPVEGRFHDGVQ